MDIDDKDTSESSNDSSGPEEISNKDAEEVAITSIKAEFASQRSLKEKAKKLKLQIEIRNIEQKKIKEEKKKAEADSSPPKLVKSGIDDKAASSGAEETKPEQRENDMKSKKNKKRKNLENINAKRDPSTGNSQADSKSDSINEDQPKKLTGAARKRKRFIKRLGKVNKNKLVKNSAIKTKKDTRHFKKINTKARNPKTNVVAHNKPTEKPNGKKRKFKDTKSDITKIESMNAVKVKKEKVN